MRVRYLPALFPALLASMFQIATSAPIKSEHWGVGTGSIGSTTFVNQEFKVTAFGDTMNRNFTLYPAQSHILTTTSIQSITIPRSL